MSDGKTYQINPELLKRISNISAVRKVNTNVIKKIVQSIEYPPWYAQAAGLTEALTIAAQYKTRIFLLFTQTPCLPCSDIDREVFSKPDFGWWVWHNNLVLVRIKMSGLIFPEDQEVNDKYEIHGYPEIVFLNCQGTECGRYEGGYAAGWGVAYMTREFEIAGKFNVTGSPCNP
jgi:thioredoxin-related protein